METKLIKIGCSDNPEKIAQVKNTPPKVAKFLNKKIGDKKVCVYSLDEI